MLQDRDRQRAHIFPIFRNQNGFRPAKVFLGGRLWRNRRFIGSRKIDLERRAFAGFALHPNPSAAPPYHAVDGRQTKTRADCALSNGSTAGQKQKGNPRSDYNPRSMRSAEPSPPPATPVPPHALHTPVPLQ
jgi:hypothetical protein